MATSVRHGGFKRLVNRNPTLAILVGGAEALTFRKDSTGNYGGLQLGVPTYSAAGCADGAGISLATGYGAALSNRFSAFEVVADTGSTDLTGDTYEAAIHGKLNIGTTQTNASLISGLFSMDVANSVNLSANYFALRGHLDFWGSTSISGTSFVGALSAYVENEATTTVGAGQYLMGVDIYQVGAPSVNASGFNSAINIRSSAAASNWKCGIYATGLKQAINATVTATGSAAVNAVEITDNDATTMASGYAHGIHVTLNKSGTTSGGASVTQVNGVGVDYTISGGNATGFYALYAYMAKSGSPTLTTSAIFGANLEVAEMGACDYLGGLWLNKYNTTLGSGIDAFILMSDQGSGVTTTCFYVQGIALPTYFLQAASANSNQFISTSATALNGITTSHKLAIRLGSTTCYIPVVTSGMS